MDFSVGDCDYIIEKLYIDFERILENITDTNLKYSLSDSELASNIDPIRTNSHPSTSSIIIFSDILNFSGQQCRIPTSMLTFLDMILIISQYLDDKMKIDRILPYILNLLGEESPTVQCLALKQMINLVRGMQGF